MALIGMEETGNQAVALIDIVSPSLTELYHLYACIMPWKTPELEIKFCPCIFVSEEIIPSHS